MLKWYRQIYISVLSWLLSKMSTQKITKQTVVFLWTIKWMDSIEYNSKVLLLRPLDIKTGPLFRQPISGPKTAHFSLHELETRL